MRKIDTIVLHHTASESSFQDVKNYHVNVRRWGEVFYHFVIDRQGVLHIGRNINLYASRQRKGAIEIAVIGHLHLRDIFDVQKETLLYLLDTLLERYGGDLEVKGHNEVSATICPGNLDVGYFRDYWQKMSLIDRKEVKNIVKREVTETWQDLIMKRGIENGLITAGQHLPNEPAEKWFVVAIANRIINRMKKEG